MTSPKRCIAEIIERRAPACGSRCIVFEKRNRQRADSQKCKHREMLNIASRNAFAAMFVIRPPKE